MWIHTLPHMYMYSIQLDGLGSQLLVTLSPRLLARDLNVVVVVTFVDGRHRGCRTVRALAALAALAAAATRAACAALLVAAAAVGGGCLPLEVVGLLASPALWLDEVTRGI